MIKKVITKILTNAVIADTGTTTINKPSVEKKILSVILGLILFFGIGVILYVNFRPGIRKINKVIETVQRDVPVMQKDINNILQAVNTLLRSDSILTVQYSRLPESPMSIEDLGRVTSKYDYRTDPKTGLRTFHSGTDFAAPRGTIVYAAAAGLVEEAGLDGGYGKLIKINHMNGYETLYAHLSSIDVLPGYQVQKGSKIGTVGNTGYSTGSHLHYEIKFTSQGKTVSVNPEIFTNY